MLDPINQAQVFTNSVIEDDFFLPACLQQFENEDIDEGFLDLAEKRINWCLKSDGLVMKLPRTRLFPYLDQKPKRRYGIPPERQERNVVNTYYDLTSMYIAKKFGFTEKFRIGSPLCVLDLEREERLVVLDLNCDFVTAAHSHFSLPLFSDTPVVTIDKPLASINPLSWTTCFDETNIYQNEHDLKLSPSHRIHTIYLSRHERRYVGHNCLVGRAIMFCYGYAMAQAKQMYGNEIKDMELADPISIQCVFHNPSDLSVGIVCFQLNTTSFHSPLKNQIWLDGPHNHQKIVLQKLIALELNGFVDKTTQTLKRPLVATN